MERHRPLIECAAIADAFEQAVSDLLAELHPSDLGFFHQSARRASSRAALSAHTWMTRPLMESAGFFRMYIAGGAAASLESNRETSC